MSEMLEPAAPRMKKVKIPPEISLDSTDLPEIKDYDVGDTYSAIIKCKMISKHQGSKSIYSSPDMEDDSDKVHGRFQILSIKPVPKESTNGSGNDRIKSYERRLSQ